VQHVRTSKAASAAASMAEAGALLAAAMTTPLLRSRCSSELPSADTGPAEDASVAQVLRFAVGTAARRCRWRQPVSLYCNRGNSKGRCRLYWCLMQVLYA